MIEVENLTKRYGEHPAIQDLSFTVQKGEILGFLGPNSAGKTTTMRILAGYMPPSSGTARVAGYDVTQDSLAVRRRIGYLPETVPLYPEMEVSGYLEFMAALCAKEALARSHDLHEQAEICRDARRAFLVEHLGRWGGQFARRIAEHARLPYYAALADLLVALLNHEAAELNVVLEEQPVTQAPEAVDFDALECAGLR